MPGPSSPSTGTGLSGSLTYSSMPVAFGGVPDEFPGGVEIKRFLGGFFRRPGIEPKPLIGARFQRDSLRELSRLWRLSARRPLSLRFCMKNGSSICSRKNSPVLESKFRLPRVRRRPCDASRHAATGPSPACREPSGHWFSPREKALAGLPDPPHRTSRRRT